MSQTKFIGKRIELVSMDSFFHNITIALYKQEKNGQPVYLVHSYSNRKGATDRIAYLIATMKTLGGLESGSDDLLYFPCGDAHEQAIKRIFLDSCKYSSPAKVTPQPLQILDRKSACEISAAYIGQGAYQLRSGDCGENCDRRIAAISRGLLKLGQMQEMADSSDTVSFACGQAHDSLIGLLLIRAPNVRAAIREAEQMSSRGVLSAPANQ